MSKKKNRQGLTSQGVRDLNHLKGKSCGRRLELPVSMQDVCEHPAQAVRIDSDGDSFCQKCRTMLT